MERLSNQFCRYLIANLPMANGGGENKPYILRLNLLVVL